MTKAEEFDGKFDPGEDETAALDLASGRRPLSLQLLAWMVEGLDREASRLAGSSRPGSRTASLSGRRKRVILRPHTSSAAGGASRASLFLLTRLLRCLTSA